MQENLENILSKLAGEEFCYVTTKGRVSGCPHQIEIWFGVQHSSLYIMAGNHRSDWVLNLRKDPQVTVRIAHYLLEGRAAPVENEQEERDARYVLAEKYQEWEEGRTLSEWARTALVVGINVSSVHETEGK